MNADKQELVNFKLTKAKDLLAEVDIQVEHHLWNTAINRLYYACFHLVSALLTVNDINVRTHAGVRQMLGLHFIIPGLIEKKHGEFYTNIFYLRQSADYEDYAEYEEKDVLPLLQPAREFFERLEEVLLQQS